MSKQAVEAIIGKAVVERDFREALYANPEEVLAGYELTPEEMAALNAIDAETWESFAGTLDERISKALIAGWGGRTSAFSPGEQGLEGSLPSGYHPEP